MAYPAHFRHGQMEVLDGHEGPGRSRFSSDSLQKCLDIYLTVISNPCRWNLSSAFYIWMPSFHHSSPAQKSTQGIPGSPRREDDNCSCSSHAARFTCARPRWEHAASPSKAPVHNSIDLTAEAQLLRSLKQTHRWFVPFP